MKNLLQSEDIFEELPYVAILNNDHISKRCSNCFAVSSVTCPMDCKEVAYCSEKCAAEDWFLHQFECELFRTGYSKLIQCPTLRFLIRFAIRNQMDGGKADMSKLKNFTLKNRSCKDLKSHYRDAKRKTESRLAMYQVADATAELLQHTPFHFIKKKQLRRMHCMLNINSFCVYSHKDDSPFDSRQLIGVGLYLNASRLNHSCRPTLSRKFVGRKMTFVLGPDGFLNSDLPCFQHSPLPKLGSITSQQQFDRLTVSYGTSFNERYGCLLETANQRKRSLRYSYYFRCRCVFCSDHRLSKLEEYAAAKLCDLCRTPFCWSKSYKVLKPICNCPKSQKLRVDKQQQQRMIALEMKWHQVMVKTSNSSCMDAVISLCVPVFNELVNEWNTYANIRLGQLAERLFVAYYSNFVSSIDNKQILKQTIFYGETMLGCYICKPTVTTCVVNTLVCAVFLCCSLIDEEQYIIRYRYWYGYMKNILIKRLGYEDRDAKLHILAEVWRILANIGLVFPSCLPAPPKMVEIFKDVFFYVNHQKPTPSFSCNN